MSVLSATPGKKTRRLRNGIATLAIAGLALGISVVAAPAAHADGWGAVNCSVMAQPYRAVHTKSHALGTVYHTQWGEYSTRTTHWTNTRLRTNIYSVGWTMNRASTVEVRATVAWLYSASRYCA